VAAIANAAVMLAAAVLLLRRASPADLAPTALLVALQTLWFSVPSLLYALGALDSANLALSALWIAIAHSIQYLWITSYYATRADDPTRVRSFLLKCLAAGAAVTVLPALVFAPPVLGPLSYQAGLAILLFSVVNLHHFVLDGAIWKLRDGRVGRILLQSASGARSLRAEAPALQRRLGLREAIFAVGAVSLAVAVVGKWEMEFGVQRALAAGDLERVTKAAERLTWIGRESHAVHQHLGLRLGKLPGRYSEARRHFERSLAIHPSVAAWTELGALDMRAGNPGRAVDSFEAALALDAGDLRTLLRLGEAWVALGRPDRAIEPLERAAMLAPGNHMIQSRLSRARRAARDSLAAGRTAGGGAGL
jgi:tetratricopeptide (TPR) repeat protein